MPARKRRARYRSSPRHHLALHYALREVKRFRHPANLPEPVRNVVLVHAAQGVIDNGGLHYFFGSDFPGTPPYSVFIDAYRAIGAHQAADALERAVALFPFPAPHKFVDRRNEFMSSVKVAEGEKDAFEELDDEFYFDGQLSGYVWRDLDAYIDAHASWFPE